MTEITIIEGDFSRPEGRIALLCARFNGFIVESLKNGALDALKRHGVKESDIDLIWVPPRMTAPSATMPT